MKTLNFISYLCLFTFLVILSSCSKVDSNSNQSLTGTWKWVRTDGGIAFHIHETHASTGKNVILNITGNNRYFIYTNGTLSNQGTFSIEIRNCIHDHTDKKVINFSDTNLNDMMIEKIDNVSLELSDDAFDGIGSVYSRE